MVEFVVRLPDGSPEWEPVYLTGDADKLGRWRPNAVRLDRWQDGTYRTSVDLPWYQTTQFLITGGTWRGAETDGFSREIVPHSVHPLGHTTVQTRGK